MSVQFGKLSHSMRASESLATGAVRAAIVTQLSPTYRPAFDRNVDFGAPTIARLAPRPPD
jgi:hypothetical protein